MLVKCVINLDGSVTNCRVIKGLPFVTESVMAVLPTWRFTPVMWQGHPQAVELVIPVRLAAQ